MKNIRLFVIIPTLFLSVLCSHAQETSFGIKAGGIIGTPYMKPKSGDSGRVGLGPSIGIFVHYTLNKHFGIWADLCCAYKCASFKIGIGGDTNYASSFFGHPVIIPTKYSGRARGNFKNFYFDLPIMLAYKIGKRFNLLLGPQLSYLYKGDNSGTADVAIGNDPVKYPFTVVNNYPYDQTSELNRWDYGIVGGTNFELSKRISVDLHGSYGLRSIYKDSYTQAGGTVRSIYIQLSAAFRLGSIKDNPETEN